MCHRLNEGVSTGIALHMRVVGPAIDYRKRPEELRPKAGDYLAEGTDVYLSQHQ